MRACMLSLQSCLTLCDLIDCSPPDSPVHGILQAWILEWVAMPSSEGLKNKNFQLQIPFIPNTPPYI